MGDAVNDSGFNIYGRSRDASNISAALLHLLFEIQSKDRVKKLVDETIIFHFLTSLLLKATKKPYFQRCPQVHATASAQRRRGREAR